jgi:hypothetical protein
LLGGVFVERDLASSAAAAAIRVAGTILVAMSVWALGGCALPNRQVRGATAYHAFKRIEGATAVGVTKLRYDELVQDASAELLVLKDMSRTPSDLSLVSRYAEALQAYRDAGVLWSEEIEDARYDWIPKDRIYLESAGFEIAARYGLARMTHRAPYTGASFETVPTSSLQTIWARAEARVSSGDSLIVRVLAARL